MVETLKLYKGDEVIATGERGEDGKATVTINDLVANTEYAVGTYQVSFSNENGESEKVDVPGFKTKPIVVSGVKLNKESTNLEVGSNETLNATVSPSTATNKNISFQSSDSEVASVDNDGKVTAIKAGTADITVTTEDGNKTATCSVTVTEPETDPEKPENVEVNENEESADVSAE